MWNLISDKNYQDINKKKKCPFNLAIYLDMNLIRNEKVNVVGRPSQRGCERK